MAQTYAYALLGALLATFTVTPVLASLLLPARVAETETLIVRGLHRLYDPVLRFALDYRRLTLAIGLAFLALAAVLAPRLGSEFLPALEEGNRTARPPRAPCA
jgi:heavy metal efflux system protein